MTMNPLPNGLCPSCKAPLMLIGGEKGCANCSTKEQVGSGLVNEVADPGHEAMEKLLKTLPTSPVSNTPLPTFKTTSASSQVVGYQEHLEWVYRFLNLQPINSLSYVKKVLKLKKKVLSLQADIKLLLEESNA